MHYIRMQMYGGNVRKFYHINGRQILIAAIIMICLGCPLCVTNGYSKAQIEWLHYIMLRDNIHITHAENGGEYHIQSVGYIDGYCHQNNTVYEFHGKEDKVLSTGNISNIHGDFYHGNPIKYDPNTINPVSRKTYGELYIKTVERDKLIVSLGYNLIIVWVQGFMKLKKSPNENIIPYNNIVSDKLGIKEIQLDITNRGKRWTIEEDESLCKDFDNKISIFNISLARQRTERAIKNRLNKLGKL
jgi:hypothetical protein